MDLKLPAYPATVSVRAQGDGAAILLDETARNGSGAVFARAHERLPVGWRLAESPHWLVDNDAPLAVQVEVDPGSPIWAPLAASFGLALAQPRVAVNLAGTLPPSAGTGRPERGTAGLSRRTGRLFPALGDLVVRVHADPTEMTVDTFTGRIAGQPLARLRPLAGGAGRGGGILARLGWEERRSPSGSGQRRLGAAGRRLSQIARPPGPLGPAPGAGQGDWSGRLGGCAMRPPGPRRPLASFPASRLTRQMAG